MKNKEVVFTSITNMFTVLKCDNCGHENTIFPHRVFQFDIILCDNCNSFIYSRYIKYLSNIKNKLVLMDPKSVAKRILNGEEDG